MLFEVFDDLTNQQLKSIIRQYNHHLRIPLKGLKRDDLLKVMHKHFDIDDEKIKLKNIEPIYFDVPEKKTYKRKVKKVEPKVKKVEPKEKIRYNIEQDEFANDLNDAEKKYFDDQYNERLKNQNRQKENFLNSVKNKDEWKYATKREKEVTCEYVKEIYQKDKSEFNKLPEHLKNYFNRHCKNNKDRKKPKEKIIKLRNYDATNDFLDYDLKTVDDSYEETKKFKFYEPLFLEYLKPDKLTYYKKRDIFDEVGDVLNEIIHIDSLIPIVENIPSHYLKTIDDFVDEITIVDYSKGKNKFVNSNGEIFYTDFIVKYIYKLLRDFFNKQYINGLDQIAISNIIANKLVKRKFFKSVTKYDIIKTFKYLSSYKDIPERFIKILRKPDFIYN